MDVVSHWEIENDTKNISGYLVQKATKKIKGRKWTAWFTNELPLSYGPFLLNGLPGLIIMAEDEMQTHQFMLSGIQKLENFNFDAIPSIPNPGRLKVITSTDFRSVYRNKLERPESLVSGENRKYFDINGKEVTETEFYRNIKLSTSAHKEINNNKLIFDFLKF